jgi:hypothetical protein
MDRRRQAGTPLTGDAYVISVYLNGLRAALISAAHGMPNIRDQIN